MAPTPAAIPVEEAAAHHSEYDPVLALVDIEPHPSNVRRDAVADPELVNSIRAGGVFEPVVVAPHPDANSSFKWRLIMGHRRKDGSEKAGHTSIPALIRYDLTDEADQVAAMLVENGRRNGLTPIEEAEGFDLLTELGWDAERIASAYGCSASTVRSRRKLTSLRPTFQEQVSAGQVTIDDALVIASLPEKEIKRLEKVAPTSMHHELARSQDRLRRQRDVEKQIKGFQQLGGTEQKLAPGIHYWGLRAAEHGLTIFSHLPEFLRTPDRHKGCLGWVDDSTPDNPSAKPVCTDVSAHDDEIAAHHAAVAAQRTEEEKQRQAEIDARAAENEAQRIEREAASETRRVAAQLRGDVILESTRRIKLPAALLPVLRPIVAGYFTDYPLDEQLFQVLAEVPDKLRWTSYIDREAYVESILTMNAAQLWRAFIAGAIAHLEISADELIRFAEPNHPWEVPVLSEYLTALTQAGHTLTPPDEELQSVIDAASVTEGVDQ